MLLILAGVSIATLTGDNGILTRANEAGATQIEGRVKEEVRLAVQSAKMYAEQMTTTTEEEWLASEKLDDVVDHMMEIDLTEEKGYKIEAGEVKITVTYENDDYRKATNDLAAKIVTVITVDKNSFTIESENSSEPIEPEEPADLPQAKVTEIAELPTVEFSGSTYTLDACYAFEVTETAQEAKASPYANWVADFTISADTDISEGELGIAADLGVWGCISVPTLAKNENYLVFANFNGMNYVTYEMLCSQIKRFECGPVALDAEAMSGVTITVDLRIYETEENSTVKTGKSYSIHKVNYKFE